MSDTDDIETQFLKKGSAEEVKKEHEMRHKTAANPARRKLIKAIGVYGKTNEQLLSELDTDATQLKFNIDFLFAGNYVTMDGETYRLTDTGIDLLGSI
ncbi:MAG: hypothetical protein KAH86_09590 [Methanosarcinales archaeon]|nr:hypothetical protein [Methanosarcinales archaeon]